MHTLKIYKFQLYSMGNYIQYPGINYKGKEKNSNHLVQRSNANKVRDKFS